MINIEFYINSKSNTVVRFTNIKGHLTHPYADLWNNLILFSDKLKSNIMYKFGLVCFGIN